MPVVGKCKLCNQQKDLQMSHAVGDSIFKKISRTNSGKGISLTSGDEAIGYSCDSWAGYQLCLDCERLLNIEYEQYSLGVLRGKNCQLSKTDLGLTFKELDQQKLIMYFLSIYWRAANSGHSAYKNVVIIDDDNEYLRNSILNNTKIPDGKFSIKISRVVDLSDSKRFSPDSIKQIVVSPFCRVYENRKLENASICFMFEGFFIEIYVKGLKLKDRSKYGVLAKSKRLLVVPYLNLFKIDEVIDLMVKNYGEYVEGNSKVKANKPKPSDVN
ncbi:hypothetical protein [Vibrio sp. E150_018]